MVCSCNKGQWATCLAFEILILYLDGMQSMTLVFTLTWCRSSMLVVKVFYHLCDYHGVHCLCMQKMEM